MPWIPLLIILAVVFLICFLVDKLFGRIFRGKKQHQSGLSVRLNKRYASIGLIVFVLGVAAMFAKGWLMIVASVVLCLVGGGLVVYYMTFGIFYDKESFIYTSFGKKSVTCAYSQILAQQLYNTSGNIVIELQMEDGRVIHLHAAMPGVYDFLNTAFYGWLKQTGRREEDCDFYDPSKSCWFPPADLQE